MSPIDPRQFYEKALVGNGIANSFGVPDSCLKGLLSYLYAEKHTPEHIVTASEGAAVALAAGYHLSTGKLALAYMQNSGLANALNPLQSLAAKEVFGIPMLLMVGWRGRPGEHDEPEHALAGPHTLDILKTNGFPYEVMPDTLSEAVQTIALLIIKAKQDNTPVALVVPNHKFAEYHDKETLKNDTNGTVNEIANRISPAISKGSSRPEDWRSAGPEPPLSRELAIRCLLRQQYKNDVTVSSVGGNSREIYMIRKESGETMARNFLSIGAMGHTYPLAYGVQMGFPSGRVFCIEGDGSFLMHVSNSAVLAAGASPNLIHVVIHNGIHCSTGNQPIPINTQNLLALAGGLPYRQKFFVDTTEGLIQACEWSEKSTLIVVVVNQSVKKTLPRPTEHPFELRDIFMESFA